MSRFVACVQQPSVDCLYILVMDYFIWHAQSWYFSPWTLWTAPLVHLSWLHFVGNALAFAALIALAVLAFGSGSGVLSRFYHGVFVIWPLTTLSLDLCPLVTDYAGASAVIHGTTALLAMLLIRHSCRNVLGWLLALGLCVKLYLEQAWIHPIVWSAEWGFNVVLVAHLYGAVVGMIVGLVILSFDQLCTSGDLATKN